MGARLEEYSADTIIVKEGEMSHRMYIVLEGQVILYSGYGTEDEYILSAYGRGKTFGEFNLYSTEPNLYTAVAFTDVKLAWFEKNNLDSFIKGYPDYALKMIENMSKSFLVLSKNLHLAIAEINELKEMIPDSSSFNSEVNIDAIFESLNHMMEEDSEAYGTKAGFHYINNNKK